MNNIKYIKRGEKYFPRNLEKLKDCPDIIYVLGNEKILNEFSLAVVGARKCSNFGREFANKISKELTAHGINIISGLASGIDTASHEGSIEANGKTIAVLGGGVNMIYPKENTKLYEKILENDGVIISEQMPNTPTMNYYLHNRNRIIAALASGIIIIEAREKSGSLITANYAKKLSKKIFVVPGSLEDDNYIR